MGEPVVAPSAYRHGLTDVQIQHAFDHPIFSEALEEGMVMLVGGDPAGNLLEVGVVTAERRGARHRARHASPREVFEVMTDATHR